MAKCLIHCSAQKLQGREVHPKEYTLWDDLILLLKKDYVVDQLCVKEEKRYSADNFIVDKTLKEIKDLLPSYDVVIDIDSFLQHLCYYTGKKCFVIFSQSDPNLFGHKENVNILKDKKYLRQDQWNIWQNVPYKPEAFMDAEKIYQIIKENL